VPAIALSEVLNHDPRLPPFVQLDLDYTSPDFVIDNNVSSAADMFSLGLLTITLYNSPHRSPLQTNQGVSAYKRLFSSSSSVPNASNNFLSSTPLPKDVVTLLQRLITRKPSVRLNARDFQNASFFDNILNSTIRFLESLPAKTPNEKSMFLRGLPRIVNQFPKTVLEKKVLPALLEEMKDKDLIALVLQNVFKIIEITPHGKRAFSEKIIPKLRETFQEAFASKTKDQAQSTDKDTGKAAGLMILLERINVIAENTTGKEFEESVWPIIRMSMESPAHALTDAALRTLPVMLNVLDFPTIKNDIFPVIAAVFSKTNSLGIKIRGLEALQTLCGGTPGQEDGSFDDDLNGFAGNGATNTKKNSVILDKYTIQEKVVPLLKAIKTKEPAVMMAALEVFKEIGKIADSDFLATDVLPILWTFALGPLLNLPQFQAFMALINTYTNRIIQEQTRKLQELSTTQGSSAQRNDFMTFARLGQTDGLENDSGVGEADFENLILGRSQLHSENSNPMDNTFDGWTNTSGTTSPSLHSPRTSMQPTATFSWSTPAPTNTMTQATQSLSSFRAITPDQSLNAFAPLQPSTTTAPTISQPLQPLRPGGMATLNPTPAPFHNVSSTQTAPSSRPIDWSSATTSTMSSSNIWASSQQPPRPASNPTFGQASLNSLPLRPAGSSPYSNFSIAPPPAGGMAIARTHQGNANVGGQVHQQQVTGQKSGLDKYESLL